MNKITDIINKLISRFTPLAPSLGVELSQHSIKVASLKEDSEGSASLLDYFILPISDIKDYDKPETLSILKEALAKMHLKPSTAVKFTLSGSKVDSKRVLLPSMPKEDIAQALRWQAKDHFLINVDEAILDFEVLEEKEKEDGTKAIEVIANIANNQAIDERTQFVKKTFMADFAPTVLTPVAYCLFNLYMLTSHGASDEPIALIDIGDSTTTIAIIKQNKISLIRQLSVSGNDFTNAMTSTLVSDKGRIELSKEEAEKLKKETGFPDESTGALKDGISAQQISSMVRPVLERLASDIKRSFDYYSSQFGEGKVTKIILSGGTSKMKNMESQLFKMLSIPVELLKIPEKLKLKLGEGKKETFENDFLQIAPAIGAAISKPEGMNLLPAAFKVLKIQKIERISVKLIATLIVSLLLVVYIFNLGYEKILHKTIKASQPQWQKLQEVQKLHAKIAQKDAILAQTLKNQVPLYYIFKFLSSLIPKEIYLKRMTIGEDATTLSMEGIVLETSEIAEVTLAEFIKNLEGNLLFNNVLLESTQDVKVSGKQAINFKISCRLGIKR